MGILFLPKKLDKYSMLDITHQSLINKGFEITTSDILVDIKNFPTIRYYGSKKTTSSLDL